MSGRTARVRGVVAMIGLVLFLGACSGGEAQSSGDVSGASGSTDQRAGGLELTSESADGQALQSPALPPIGRQVIATADVTIRVDDVATTLPDLIRSATVVGGYVAGEDTTSDPDDPSRTRSTVVLRVPTQSLQRVLDDVSGLGELLRSRQDVRDVTEQVVDVDSRVKSARASVARIRVLLDQATTLGEVVRVESQLAQREADLEALLATQRSLADQTALATLTVTALGPEAAEPPAADEDGFVAGLARGWDAFVDVIVVALTAIGLLLPFAIAGALILTPVYVVWRRRQTRARSVGTAQPQSAAPEQTVEVQESSTVH